MGFLRKLLRRIFYAAAAVSTLLLLATLILWPVSYYHSLDADYVTTDGNEYDLGCDSGRARLTYSSRLVLLSFSSPHPGLHFSAGNAGWPHWTYLSWRTPDPNFQDDKWFAVPTFLGVCRFQFLPGLWVYSGLLIPCSYLALLFAILPLLALRSIRRRRKLARVGLCKKCGYDLRAHAIGEKCPECGTAKKM